MLLVLRPRWGGDATAARAVRLGFDAVVAPLFHYRGLPWSPPDPATVDTLLLTSAATLRFGGGALARFTHLPVQAVGTATAAAARAAGFGQVSTAGRDAAAAVVSLAERGHRVVFHPVGLDHHAVTHPALIIRRVPVYAAEAVQDVPDAARRAVADRAVVLLHSARAAHVFTTLLERAGLARSAVRVACFSPAIADTAGPGWAGIAVAATPTDDALFAAARLLCDQGRDGILERR